MPDDLIPRADPSAPADPAAGGRGARGPIETPEPVSAVRRVGRSARMLLTPGWICLHVLLIAAVVAMVLLGRWQLQVSDRKHFDAQNFGYVLQWWAFAGFSLAIWLRVMRDRLRPPPDQPSAPSGDLVLRGSAGPGADGPGGPGSGSGAGSRAGQYGPAEFVAVPAHPADAPVVYRGYVMPRIAETPARSYGDEVHESYNDYLWQLALADAEKQARRRGAPARGPAVPAAARRVIDDARGVIEARAEDGGSAGAGPAAGAARDDATGDES
jgi:DNA-binding transcriptional regulator of glucitol operon